MNQKRKMSKEKLSYQLNERHQLIDLNQKIVNFKLEFKVESEPLGKEFYAIVMNQNQINEYEKLDQIDMKVAPGKIGGTIVADNNKYQNYFLILKSKGPTPTKVNVHTDIQEIEPKVVEEEIKPTFEPSYENDETVAPEEFVQVPMYKKPWFWLVIAVAVAVLGYLCYDYIVNRRINGQGIFSKSETVVPTVVAAESPAPVSSTAPSVEDQMYSKVGSIA